jgi:hypothetical protein
MSVKYVASGFLLGSLYHPEDGGYIFLRNSCSLFSGLHSVVTPEDRAVPVDRYISMLSGALDTTARPQAMEGICESIE